ncbi:MAG: alkaline phosphatase family protein [Bryobacteraceae bacterium]
MDLCRRTFTLSMMGGMSFKTWGLTPRPNLFVLVLIELLRPDFLETAWGKLSNGGFRKLLTSGAYFPDCRHLASTFPSTTLATLATGAWPAEHGIVADSWWDRRWRQTVKASAEEMLATTVASQIAAEAGTRVYVVAPDMARAGLVAPHPAARLFWQDREGRFDTLGTAPDWLGPFNTERPIEALHGAGWLAAGAPAGSPPLRELTWDAARPQVFDELYQSSPFAAAAQFDFLRELAANERLGQSGSFDFVCLVVSAPARLGFETGAFSPLIEQMTLQLDLQMESLLTQLRRTLGDKGFDLALAGCHGAPPAPSPSARPRMAVAGESVAQAVESALHDRNLGHVEKYLYPFLYLDGGTARDLEPMWQTAAAAALEHPAVAGYYTAGGACSSRDEWERRFRNSFHPRRCGDVMLSYRPEYVEDYGQGRGISYGSLYNYDTGVPLCFYGPRFRSGSFESPVEAVDLAPTLARACGVAPPSSSTGRVLAEALAE